MLAKHVLSFGISKIERSPKENLVGKQVEQSRDHRNCKNDGCPSEASHPFTKQDPKHKHAGGENHRGANPNCESKQKPDYDRILAARPSTSDDVQRRHHDQRRKWFRKEISRIRKN